MTIHFRKELEIEKAGKSIPYSKYPRQKSKSKKKNENEKITDIQGL